MNGQNSFANFFVFANLFNCQVWNFQFTSSTTTRTHFFANIFEKTKMFAKLLLPVHMGSILANIKGSKILWHCLFKLLIPLGACCRAGCTCCITTVCKAKQIQNLHSPGMATVIALIKTKYFFQPYCCTFSTMSTMNASSGKFILIKRSFGLLVIFTNQPFLGHWFSSLNI